MSNELDERTSILYDYLYNNNTTNQYKIKPISLGKIDLDDIKMKYEETNPILDVLLSGKFKFISYENNEIRLKNYAGIFPLDISIDFYKSEKNINDINSTPNLNSIFSYIASQLVLEHKTKHILLPIINIDCPYDVISHIISEDEVKDNIKKQLINDEISKTCCVHVREHFFKSIF